MVTREKFIEELDQLENLLTDISDFAMNALNQSLLALQTQDVDLALNIMENDTEADLLYEEINDFAILLIAKQQPVASDLRKIIMSLKIATDVERIADFAVNIAKSTIRIGKTPLNIDGPMANINRMYEISRQMFKEGFQAFKEEDIHVARQVAQMDDEVDTLYGETILQLFKLNQEQPNNIDHITQLLFICRYLERTADHITNVAENVFYLVKGKHYDLNE